MDIGASKPALAPLPAQEERNSPLWKAAQGLEAQFLKEMMRNMRKTVDESPESKANRGLQIFRGMLDDEYAEKAAKTQGIGLAELVVRQMLEMQEQAKSRGMPVHVRPLNASDVIKNAPASVEKKGE